MADSRAGAASVGAGPTLPDTGTARAPGAERLLRLLIESTPGEVAIFDREMRYLAVSRSWKAKYRLADTDLVGRSHYDVFPDLPERWKEVHRRCLAGAVERCEEDPFPRADGTVDWLRWEMRPWHDEAGAVGGAVLRTELITSRMAAEEALRRERRALLMLTRCTEAILRAESEQALLAEVCRVIVETGGHRLCWVGVPEQDEGRSVRPVASAGQGDGYLAAVDIRWSDTERGRGPTGTAVRTGQPMVDHDFAADPRLAPWRDAALRRGFRSCSAFPLVWQGQRLGVLTIYAAGPRAFDEAEVRFLAQLADDLAFGLHALRERARRVAAEAERSQALERLADEKERLAVTLRSLGEAVVVTDATGRITLMNGMAECLTGWPSSAAAGRPVGEVLALLDEATGAPLDHPVERALREGGAVVPCAAVALVPRERPPRPVAPTASVIRDTAGQPAGAVLVFRDLTEERRAAEQVRQAQKLESIGRLAGGVAHDFNNLLTVILSCSQALRLDLAAGNAPDPEDVQEIQAAGERARDLTRQLLAFARKQVIAPRPMDLNATVRGGEKLLRRVLGEDVDLQVRLQPDLWTVLADLGQLEQVLLNLAVNARDAMPRGGRLTIETRNASVSAAEARATGARPGDWVRLTVRDTGEGMTPEVMAHLFEPFFTTKRAGQGTGLGLATVYGIVDQSGGEVQAESAPGAGTTFVVSLPRGAEALAPPTPPPAAAPRAAATGHEVVLVVEDDPQVREVTARALRGRGYEALVAGNGAEATAIAAVAPRLALVVTDVVMPDVDGRALVEALRRRHPGLRALYVSGYAQDRLGHRGVLDPGIELLPKPFTASDLLARVRALLDAP